MSIDRHLANALAEAPEFLTPQQVAQLLQVNTRTVGRWRAAGRLKSIRTSAGRRAIVRIPKSALLDFLGGAA